MHTHTEQCKYTFTGEELVDLARKQARHMGELTEEEERFDSIKADHKSRVTIIEANISDCTRRVTSGYEMRSVNCVTLKFRPDKDSALVVRLDSGRVLRKRKLEADEKQLKLAAAAPEQFVFEADFEADTGGGSVEVVEIVAEHVPLTAKEAEALRESGLKLRPLRPLIEDSGDAAEERRKKRGKDAGAGN